MILRQSSKELLGVRHLLVLAAGTFTLGMDGFVLTGLLPQIASDLSVSIGVAGQLTTIFAISYALASPVIATLTGDLDRRIVLGAGMAVFLLGMICQAAGAVFAVVAIGRVLSAIGAAGFQATAFAVAGTLSAPERRGRSLAVVLGGGTVSMVFGVPFGVLLGQWIGWRGAMWTIAVVAVIAGALVLGLPAMHTPATPLRERLRILGNSPVRAILVSTILFLVPSYLVLSYLPAILGTGGNGSATVVALLTFGIGQVLSNRMVGRLVDRRGALPVLLFGGTTALTACIALGLLQHWPGAAVVPVFVLGAAVGLMITPQQYRFFTTTPEFATVALGLNGSAIYLGAAIGTALGGLVLHLGDTTWLPAAATIVALITFTTCWAIAPERQHN